MTRGRHNGLLLAGLMLALVALALALAAPAADAKKKGGGTVDITKTVNLPIPDRGPNPTGGTPLVPLTSTIEVGKQFKGKEIRDVNVTLQTLGMSGNTPASQLQARLVAPSGANTYLFFFLAGAPGAINRSIGPLTFDDEAPLDIGIGFANNSTRLYLPWAGTAAPSGGQLWPLDNGPVRGTWTLNLFDQLNTQTSNLVSWRLNVAAGKPFQTK